MGELTEEMRIDGHAVDLGSVRGLAVMENGTLAVGQPQSGEVWFFDAAGDLLGSFGRRGQGPGEVTFLGTVGLRADTVFIFDPAQQRLTFVSPERELLRTAPMPTEIVWEGQGLPDVTAVPEAIDPDGSMYVWFMSGVTPPGPLRDTQVVAALSPAGVVERLTAQVAAGSGTVRTPAGSAPHPFSNRGMVAVSPQGQRSAAAIASLEGPGAGTVTVEAWDRDGESVWSLRLPFEQRQIPAQARDSALAWALQGVQEEFHEQYLAAVRFPPVYPPLADIRIGDDGTTWLAMTELDEDGGRLHLAVSPHGEFLGPVRVPRGGRVAAVHQDRIWVLEEDGLGVQSITRYAVSWP